MALPRPDDDEPDEPRGPDPDRPLRVVADQLALLDLLDREVDKLIHQAGIVEHLIGGVRLSILGERP